MADRRRILRRVAVYGLGVLGLPALWRTHYPEEVATADGNPVVAEAHGDDRLLSLGKQDFSRKPLNRMIKEQPEYVFLGDSMAGAFVEPKVITELTGHRASVLYLPASTSARWYLMLKNYVLGAGLRPRGVFLIFRDCLWNLPGFRVEGAFWDEIERCIPSGEDEAVRAVLGTDLRGSAGMLEKGIRDRIYPIQTARPYVQRGMEHLAAAVAGGESGALRDQVNQLFSFENARRGLETDNSNEAIDSVVKFTADPSLTFLPHVISLAKEHGVPLFFIRVKRRVKRSRRNGEPPELIQYVADMKQWLESQGVGFYDMTPDAGITPDMYAEGDHLAVEHRDWYTRRLYEQIRGAFR